MRTVAVLVLAALCGCTDSKSDLASCEADTFKYPHPSSSGAAEHVYINNCMVSRGYDFRSEDESCFRLLLDSAFLPACFEQRGAWRWSKLQLQKLTAGSGIQKR